MQKFLSYVWVFSCTLIFTSTAFAQNYVIAPFQIDGSEEHLYLQKAIPLMLNFMLTETLEPVQNQNEAWEELPPETEIEAQLFREKYDADYIIFGTVNIEDTKTDIELQVLDYQNKLWSISDKGTINSLTETLESMVEQAKNGAFEAPPRPSATALDVPSVTSSFSIDDMVRSNNLEMESLGFEVVDINGDGLQEVLIITPREIIAYRFKGKTLTEIANKKFPTTVNPISIRSIKKGDQTWIVVSCHDTQDQRPRSQILIFENNKFVALDDKIPYYLNVVPLGASLIPTLIGQRGAGTLDVIRGDIFKLDYDGKDFSDGNILDYLPRQATVFNFAWVPADDRYDEHYIAIIDKSSKLTLFDSTGYAMAFLDKEYAATGVYILTSRSMIASTNADLDVYYYIPMRMIPTDLNNDGLNDLLVTTPTTAWANLFDSNRMYPEGKVQALNWSGLNMVPVWETSEITGTLTDMLLGDPNNDGVLDLVLCVNTYPGNLGFGKIRSFIITYPLTNIK